MAHFNKGQRHKTADTAIVARGPSGPKACEAYAHHKLRHHRDRNQLQTPRLPRPAQPGPRPRPLASMITAEGRVKPTNAGLGAPTNPPLRPSRQTPPGLEAGPGQELTQRDPQFGIVHVAQSSCGAGDEFLAEIYPICATGPPERGQPKPAKTRRILPTNRDKLLSPPPARMRMLRANWTNFYFRKQFNLVAACMEMPHWRRLSVNA